MSGPLRSDSALIHRLRCGLSSAHHRGVLPLMPDMRHSVHVAICLRGHARLEHGAGSLRHGMREVLTLELGEEMPGGSASACAQFVCLWLSPRVLIELAGSRGKAMLQACRGQCAPQSVPADPDLLACATRLMGSLADRGGCPLLRDAWSLELLARVLSHAGASPRMVLRAGERERIEHARSLLLADPSCPPTVDTLARASGLNVFRLKQGFRSVYGQTIHALYQQERMQLAWQLIESGTMDVANAGEHVGYSNLSHFGDAFRRRFGVLPSELKRCAQQSMRVSHPGCPEGSACSGPRSCADPRPGS